MANKKDLKRRLFVSYYLGESRMNATDAARRAGYAAANQQSLQNQASQLLREPETQAMLNEKVESVEITQAELLLEMADLARWNWRDNKPNLSGPDGNAQAKWFDTMMRGKLKCMSDLLKTKTEGVREQAERFRQAFEKHKADVPEMSDDERMELFREHIEKEVFEELQTLLQKAKNRKMLAEAEAEVEDPMEVNL